MSSFEKARLSPADEEGISKKDFEIEFMFNPTNLSFKKSVNWGPGKGKTPKPAEDLNVLSKSNFSGVSPYSLTITGIIFDTYESDPQTSVWTKYIEKLHKATLPPKKDKNSKDKRPAVYNFIWGKPLFFRCVVKELTYIYEMFLSDGTPVRAKVNLTLQEVDKVTDSNSDAKPDRTKDNRTKRKKK